eukprot:8870284-Pyramimonas_sp.AAC.2
MRSFTTSYTCCFIFCQVGRNNADALLGRSLRQSHLDFSLQSLGPESCGLRRLHRNPGAAQRSATRATHVSPAATP